MRSFAPLICCLLLLAGPASARPLRVLALGYHVSADRRAPDRSLRWVKPDARLQRELARRGITVDEAVYGPALDDKLLRRYQVVVLLGAPLQGQRPAVEQMVRRKMALLHRHVARGGGLLYLHAPAWGMGRQEARLNRWLRRYGGRVLREQVTEPPARLHRIQRVRTPLGWTDSLARHRVTRGVGGLFYPVARNAWHNYTQPVKVSRRWRVLVRGEATARSVRGRSGGAPSRVVDDGGSYRRSPPLLAVRQAGRGRLALWPTASTCLWQDGYHRQWRGQVMDGAAGARRSRGLALLEQLLRWLGRSTPRAAGPEVIEPPAPAPAAAKPLAWDRIRPRGAELPQHYVGLVGAQSDLSLGSASPAQMIRAARAAGYQFVAFTEELSRMDAAKTRRLIQACRAGSTPTFQAVPGFHYRDEAGNAHVVFGPRVRWPDKAWLSKKAPGRVTYNNVFFRGLGFQPLAVVRSASNPKKPWLLGNFKGFAVYSYVGGKRVDDSSAHYRTLQAMGYNLFPLALHLSRSPAAVKAARGPGLMQTYVRWWRASDPVAAITGPLGAVVKGRRLHYFPAFVSSGPIIEDFRTINAAVIDLAQPGRQRHRTHLLVSAAAGLAQVELRHGPSRRYRITARGKRLGRVIDGFHDRQRAPLLEVTDAAGGRAISWSRLHAVQEYSFVSGADNFNTIHGGKWATSAITPLRGVEDYVRLTQLRPLPRLMVHHATLGQRELDDSARPAVRQDVRVASRFGSVVEYSATGHYPRGATSNWNLAVVEPWRPNKNLLYRVRVTRYRPHPDGVVVDLIKATITPRRDLIITSHNNRGLPLLHTASPGFLRLDVTGAGGKVTRRSLAGGVAALEARPARGGFAALSPAPGGSVAYVPLQKGLRVHVWRHARGGGMWLLGGRPGQRLKAGRALTFSYLAVNGGLGAAGTTGAGFITDLISKMGLGASGATAYRVQARRGKVTSRRLVLKLAASRGAFSGRVSRAKLPLDLPVRLTGLNGRWDALLWYRGQGQFLVPLWRPGRDHVSAGRQRRTLKDEQRRFPVSAGAGMLQLDTELGARDVFIGHPVQASDRRLYIQLTDTRKGRERVWLHNSEKKAITTTVWRDPDFSLLPAFKLEVTVPAGESRCIRPGKEKKTQK